MFSLIEIYVSHGDLIVTSGFGLEFYLDLRWLFWGGLIVTALRIRKVWFL